LKHKEKNLLINLKERLIQAKDDLLKMRIDETQIIAIDAVDISNSYDDTKKAFDRVIRKKFLQVWCFSGMRNIKS
jgi:hypothetical protein